jgi:hypothetical protein
VSAIYRVVCPPTEAEDLNILATFRRQGGPQGYQINKEKPRTFIQGFKCGWRDFPLKSGINFSSCLKIKEAVPDFS